MTQPTIILSPRKPAVSAQGGVLEVLVRVQAADQPADAQAQVTAKRLALVVDRSGSMTGEPLTEALNCVAHIAGCMTPADQLSVVVYDHRTDVLMPLGKVASAEHMRRLLAGVESGGNTNLFAGWEAGAKELEGGVDHTISRVILLSDGQANNGLCEVSEIEKHCAELLARGVSTTTVGLGRGFNEDLMIAMARSGGGQQYYGQTAADLYDNFDEELQLLQALCLRKIDLKLIPGPGVIIEPLGLVQQNADGSYRLSDLAWSSETWLMLRLHLSPSTAGSVRDLLAVSLQAQALDGSTVCAHAAMLSLPVVEEATATRTPADPAVQERLQEVEFVQASEALRALVQQGRTREARSMVNELEKRFGQHAWLSGKLKRLRDLAEHDPEMMSKEIRFSIARMSSRLANRDDDVPFENDQTEADMPAFLRKKVEEGKGRKRSS